MELAENGSSADTLLIDRNIAFFLLARGKFNVKDVDDRIENKRWILYAYLKCSDYATNGQSGVNEALRVSR